MGQFNSRIQGLPPAGGSDEPTLGSIKRALHDLSRTAADPAHRDSGAALREANDLLRRLALDNGIDPDNAVRQRLAAVALLRERMVLASAATSAHKPG